MFTRHLFDVGIMNFYDPRASENGKVELFFIPFNR